MTRKSEQPSERHSEVLKIRLPPALLKRARELSARKGESVSTITRAALIRVMSEELVALKERADKRGADAFAMLKLAANDTSLRPVMNEAIRKATK